MTTADRPALIRCTIVLSSMTWLLPLAVLGLCLILINELAGVDPFRSLASHAGSETIEIGLQSLFQGHSLAGFVMALAVFAVFAIGSLLALASLLAGGMAMKLGPSSTSLIVGIAGSTLYLALILGIILGASVNGSV
ncbi:MAG: hypothetical protein CMJ29_06420 [Phycisphaerae bacterium]|nr:hypothetical protein [Phycisphaerae bacterium]|tara:strand:+ start:453 stop:863 length:411 start_codon:yes stop_codon:yes gene_type:complete